ncbi:MAG: hypothetical protein GXO49_04570 [Chlorobi bacterium]|nr:hypothetical protein [Chlorobiota bacterium]
MKKNVILLSIIMIFNYQLFAQVKNGVTNESKIVYNGQVRAILENGETVEGQTSYSKISDDKLKVQVEGEKKVRKYKIKDVKEFTINDTLEFIKVKSTTSVKFVRPLVDRNNKLKVYALTYQSPISSGVDGNKLLFPTYREYWVLLPGKKKAVSVKDITLSVKKVANSISDCEDLSKKVLKKENGYKLSKLYSAEKLVEVYKKISEEYEGCN